MGVVLFVILLFFGMRLLLSGLIEIPNHISLAATAVLSGFRFWLQ